MMPSFLSRKKPHSVYGAVGGSASSTAVAASSSATQIPSSISAPTGFTHVAHVGPSVGPAASSSRLDHPAPTHALAYGQPTAVPYDPVEAQRISAQQVAEMYRAPAQPPAAYGGGPRTDYVTEGYRYSGEHDYGAARARQLSSETRLSGSAQSGARNDYYQPRELDHRSSASSLNSARSNGLSSGQSANRSSSGGTSASTMPPEPLTPPPMLTHGPPHPSYEHTKATPTPAYYSSGESPAMQQTPPAAQHSGVMTPSVSSMGTLTINSPNMSVTSSQRKTSSRYALGDFEFIRTLGTGSFGRVHLVRSRHNTRYYAVKVRRRAPGRADRAGAVERARRQDEAGRAHQLGARDARAGATSHARQPLVRLAAADRANAAGARSKTRTTSTWSWTLLAAASSSVCCASRSASQIPSRSSSPPRWRSRSTTCTPSTLSTGACASRLPQLTAQ